MAPIKTSSCNARCFNDEGWTSISHIYRSDSDAYAMGADAIVTALERGFNEVMFVTEDDDLDDDEEPIEGADDIDCDQDSVNVYGRRV